MAKYTVELRTVVESGINIFSFPYEFYDETKREKFERDFIRHFYFREIGCETVDRFKLYLRDKMETVFPYYNELFKSASIKYDVLDNYKLTETYTRNYQNDGKTSGITSNVGQYFGNQSSESNRDTTGKADETENTTHSTHSTGLSTTDTENNSVTDTENNNTTEDNTTRTNTSNNTTETDDIKKFLDTPQGATSLEDSKYLTTLNHDTGDTKQNSSSTDKTIGVVTSDSTGKSETDSTGKTTTNTTDDVTGESERTLKADTTGNEKINATATDEQKTTQDSNTRNYHHNEHKEEYTLTRRGNIGVDTDSDAIEKHNRLQKTLKNIERMFFEECEDLFMLVY